MGRRGPRPTPAPILKLRGTFRPDRACDGVDPGPEVPDCPEWLDDDAKAVWHEVAPRLELLGLLTMLDERALARYCDTWVRWRKARDFLAAHGEVYSLKDESGRVKYLQAFPQVSIATKLEASLSRLEAEFGLTPSARSRLRVEGPPAPGVAEILDAMDEAG